MLDVIPELISTLETVLPVYNEYYCDSTMTLPCITYRQTQNRDTLTGDTIGYSDIEFMIKVWGNIDDQLEQYILPIDTKMRKLGYKRTNYNELQANNQIELIINYNGLAKETY